MKRGPCGEHRGSLAAEKTDADKIADRSLRAIPFVYRHLTGDLADGQLRGVFVQDEA
jgi:hypothetical protein